MEKLNLLAFLLSSLFMLAGATRRRAQRCKAGVRS